MSWPELHHTLLDLLDAVSPPDDGALRVELAEIDVPLEVRTTSSGDGPVMYARAPHSRWIAGVLPTVQTGRLVIERTEPT